MLADEVDYVIGVDTHRDQHTIAVVVAPTGAVLSQTAIRASGRGYAQALRFAEKHAGGVRAWAIEGAGHYGAGLTRYLRERGETVLEAGRQARMERRLHGKDDPLDAIRAARSGLAAETLTLPRVGQRQEALRVLLLTRRSAVDVRRVALVQLRSVIVTAPEHLRDELRRLSVTQLIRRCSRFRRSGSRTPDELAIVLTLRSLARRIEAATAEADQLEREILNHVRALVPALLDEAGVGPIVAAQLIVTWSHHGRGGDRQLNRALHTVVLHRRQHDPTTRDYIARRVAEGKSTRDATRILKRYLARHLYRVMQNATPLTT